MKKEEHDMWKTMFESAEAPESLKNEVFDSLASLRLLGNVMDLFSEKLILTQSNFLSNFSDEDNDNPDTPEEKKEP